MNSSSESMSIGDMVARRTVVDYGECSFVTLPGWTDLPEAERKAKLGAVCRLLQQQPLQSALDVEALDTALRDFSRYSPTPSTTPPPPTREEEIEDARSSEERARKALVEDGCPPCYPTDLEPPLENIPEQYNGIVSYWQYVQANEDLVLCTQLQDWAKFRNYQGRVRQYHRRRKTFADFLEKVRDRRRRYGLKGDICLQLNSRQQSRLETWIEFQNNHLEIHDGLEKEIKDDGKELDAARKKLETGASALTDAQDVESFKHRVGYTERRLRQHEILLRWIEEQRVAFAADQALSVDTSVTQDDGSQAKEDKPSATPRSPAPARRKRGKNTCSVLGPIRSAISKNQSQKRSNLRPPKRDVPQSAEKATGESNAPRCSQRIRDLRGNKPQHGKESTPLRPFRPQRVSKPVRKFPTSKPRANAKGNSNPRPRSQLQGGRKQDSAERASSKLRRPIHSTSMVMTRSGRQSKRSERFCAS